MSKRVTITIDVDYNGLVYNATCGDYVIGPVIRNTMDALWNETKYLTEMALIFGEKKQ